MVEDNTLEIFIGQKVSSKKTGFPGIGTIIGIVHPGLYAMFNRTSVEDMMENNKTWTELHPEWYKHPIVYVYYKEPRRTITWEEAQKYNASYEDWENYPMSSYLAYVIQDLEVIE